MHLKGLFRVILVFSGALFCVPAIAQSNTDNNKASSYSDLKLKYKGMSANDLLNEARSLKEKDPREALNKVEVALGASLAQKDVLNEGKCYVMLGEINEGIEEWKLALENYNSGYEKLKNKYATIPEFKTALRGLSEASLRLGDHARALQFYQEALALRRLSTNERANIQLGISEVYYQMGNYEEARRTIDNIVTSHPKEVGAIDESLTVAIQSQRAKLYARTNDVEKAKDALEYSQSTLRSNRAANPQLDNSIPQQKQEEGVKAAKEQVVEVLHDQQRYDEEIDLRNKAIEYNLESKNLPEVTKDKVGISKALEAKGETSEAIRELEEAARMADTVNSPKDQAKAFLALAGIYEKHGRNTQALSAYRRYSDAVKKAETQNETRLTEKAELIKKQKDIEELKKDVAIGQREETIEKGTVFRQQLVIYGLLLIIAIIAVTSYFIYKNAQASKIANQLLALKSLRSQMNPHFIFNALNSVNHFIAQNDERTANKFLSEFSRLMRLVLENSQEDFIPLYKEQEIISLYLKLEHYRFRDKFDYDMKVDEDINPETIEIPPMLLQPYIENAVWHGLRYKEAKGHLSLHMRRNSHGLEVEITDNGIGRKRSAALKTDNQKKQTSTALKNIEERLTIINKVYRSNYSIDIRDLDTTAGTGTRVLIHVPEQDQNRRP